MEMYNERGKCPKCGNDYVTTEYQKSETGFEFMKRICKRCGYEWREACLEGEMP